MKYLKLLILSAVALILPRLRIKHSTANVESVVGTHKVLTVLAEAAHVDTHLLIQFGTDINHGVPCTTGFPIGTTTDNPDAAGDIINVHPLGIGLETRKVRVATALAADVAIYAGGANGYAQGEPNIAGSYYKIGHSVSAASETAASDYIIEFIPHEPIKVVVIAALTSVQNATAAATDLPSSEALANALKANYNALQADVAAIGTALATPALVKVI